MHLVKSSHNVLCSLHKYIRTYIYHVHTLFQREIPWYISNKTNQLHCCLYCYFVRYPLLIIVMHIRSVHTYSLHTYCSSYAHIKVLNMCTCTYTFRSEFLITAVHVHYTCIVGDTCWQSGILWGLAEWFCSQHAEVGCSQHHKLVTTPCDDKNQPYYSCVHTYIYITAIQLPGKSAGMQALVQGNTAKLATKIIHGKEWVFVQLHACIHTDAW